jgi:hypothetical protein
MHKDLRLSNQYIVRFYSHLKISLTVLEHITTDL